MSENKIILIGGGGHCRSCIDVIESEGVYSIYGILDTTEKIGESILDYKVIGVDDDIPIYVRKGFHFLITIGHIGNARLRKELYELVLSYGGTFAKIVSPRAYVAKSSYIGSGSIIMHDALINVNSRIHENCIINTKALVEHDVEIRFNSHISTGAIVNGGTVVESETFLGSNATTKEYIKIEGFIKAGSLIK